MRGISAPETLFILVFKFNNGNYKSICKRVHALINKRHPKRERERRRGGGDPRVRDIIRRSSKSRESRPSRQNKRVPDRSRGEPIRVNVLFIHHL